MRSERIQRRIDQLLDEADSHQPSAISNWPAGTIYRAATETGDAGSDSVGARHAVRIAPKGQAEAMRHLDIAIAELHEMHMQPALERALRPEDVLKACRPTTRE